jgi:diguanylate cyclase (GGDEF)-like protein
MKVVRVLLRDRLLSTAIVGLVVIGMALAWYVSHARGAEAADGRQVRTVQDQVARSYELSVDALLFVAGDAGADQVTGALDRMVAIQTGLRLGDDDLGLPGVRDALQESLYADAQRALQVVMGRVDELLASPDPFRGVQLVTDAAEYRRAMVPIGRLYLGQAAQRAALTAQIEIIWVSGGFAIALGIAMLLRPYTRRRNDLAAAFASARQRRARGQLDALTGLPKRSDLRDGLIQAVNRATRGEQFTGLLMVAVDRAPGTPIATNDPNGDGIISGVARVLQDTLRSTDVVARAGRDMFAIIVDIRRSEDTGRVADKVLETLARPIGSAGIEPTISVGIAVAPEDSEVADELMGMATAAMQEVRRSGGDGFGYYALEAPDQSYGTLEIVDRLRSSIRRNEGLWLAYQPKVRVDGRTVAGFEALVRWSDDVLGDLLPDDFVPIAEQSDLIVELGNWVINEACRQMAAWQAAGRDPLPVSVNVSPRQMRLGDLHGVVESALRRHGIDPSLLELEITEAVILDEEVRPMSRIRDLRALGVTFALDDFGTGFSSLSYLKRLSVDALKIDRSFVQGLSAGSPDTAIASMIVALGRSLDLEVVAEGVETEEQLTILDEMGCLLVQGFLFGEPLPAGAITRSGATTQIDPTGRVNFDAH